MSDNDIFNEINDLSILEVLSRANIQYKKDSGSPYMYTILKSDGRRDESFKINASRNIAVDFWGDGVKWWPFDIIGRLVLQVDTKSLSGKKDTLAWFVQQGFVKDKEFKTAFEKPATKEELLANFEDYKIGWFSDEVFRWLATRWVPHTTIQKETLLIGEIFRDVGLYSNYYCTQYESHKREDGVWENREWDEPRNVPVLMFPCYDEFWAVIGIKLRRVDWKGIRGKKSYAIGKTGLLWWGNIQEWKPYLLVEWESDAVILRILWYKYVLANLWGCQAHKDKISSVLYANSQVTVLYDWDHAGQMAKLSLAEVMGRVLFQIDMPMREWANGERLSDVNDLYKVWYNTKKKWDEILADAYEIGLDSKDSTKPTFRYIFLDKFLEFYDTQFTRVQQQSSVASSLGLTSKELFAEINTGVIKKYIDLCYLFGGKEWYYNTLDDTQIVMHWGKEKPKLHPHIELLINNIGWHKKKNIHWIHQAILYKITHINDVNLPALILYGSWGSGKGTFINLLSFIFGKDNTQTGLGQKDLENQFDTYVWKKLIVEFKEISSWNTYQDKKILDRLKGVIWEARIMVNEKFQNPKEVDNIAWFHLSSNHPVPIQLDSKHSGNRRFTVIKTGNMLDPNKASDMNRYTFPDKKIIQQYVAWLYETYPEVPAMKIFPALDNAEKKMLEEQCEWVGNQVLEWFEKKYPHVWKLSAKQMKEIIEMYKLDEWIEFNDKRYSIKNLNMSLSHRYEHKAVNIDWETRRGYFIIKTKFQQGDIPESHPWYFTQKEWNEIMFKKNNTF